MRLNPGDLIRAPYTDEDVAALKALHNDQRHKRAFEWIILGACMLNDEPLVLGQPDLTANRQGRRSAGLQIMNLIKMPPKEIPGPSDVLIGRKRAVKG